MVYNTMHMIQVIQINRTNNKGKKKGKKKHNMTNPHAKDIYSQHYNTSVVETKALSDQFFQWL